MLEREAIDLAQRAVPTHPKIRLLQPRLVEHQGRRLIYLHDDLGITKQGALIPQPLAPLLALCDGTRDVSALRAGMLARTGAALPENVISEIVAQLDDALLLENGAFRDAAARVMRKYRSAKHRQSSHAGAVYPVDARRLSAVIADYCARAPAPNGGDAAAAGSLAGMLCPHIDYARGHRTYAELWQRAKPALADVELVVIFGTDHSGGPGALTPTRQNYATPYGVLPTDTAIVDGLADALGEGAYAEEIHHTKEHSIELAAVWLHHFIGGRECAVVPILCGSFHRFVNGRGSPGDDERLSAAVAFLRDATAGRRTLVIAAGDLAHVGPAFGDAQPLDAAARAKLTADDRASMSDICKGDAERFFERSRSELDARRICGISPIYLALKYLEGGELRGEWMGYDQCAADPQGGSVVSIAGALLYEA